MRAAGLDDVKEFFATYYHPANASVSIAGDVQTRDALAEVRRHFETLPAGPRPPAPDVPVTPESDTDQRLLLLDQVELPRLYLSWPSPPLFAPGDAELDLLGEVLSGGKSSRLYRTLVHDRRIATEVHAGQSSRELSSSFSIVATAAPGRSLAELEEVIIEELARLQSDGPTDDEVERIRTNLEADFVYRLQTVGGFGGLSDQLNAYNVFTGDPGYGVADRARYADVGPDQVREVARTYLRANRRVALSVIPTDQDLDLALPGSTAVSPR